MLQATISIIMKAHIQLNSDIYESSKSFWSKDICFKEIMPTPKVLSVLEVCGETTLAALSAHYDYLAVINGLKGETETLFIVALKERRVTPVKSFIHPVTMVHFTKERDDDLFVGLNGGQIYHFSIEANCLKVLESHSSDPVGVALYSKSKLLMSWSSSDVLIWSWPQCTQLKRLKIDPNYVVRESGFLPKKNLIFAAFDTGVILVWNQENGMKETALKAPDGVNMKFNSFSVSVDEDWIIGVGSENLIVVYSVVTQKVAQVIHFSQPGAFLSCDYVQCLPPILPQYPKTYLMKTSNCVFLVDFHTSAVIKALKSHRYSISDVCVSSNGFIVGVVYAKGTTKLYTLPSFFPQSSTLVEVPDAAVEDVHFKVLNLDQTKPKKIDVESLLDETKWLKLLEEFGEFPAKYRKYIWASICKLPRNFSLFSRLLQKNKKYSFESLQNDFPMLEENVFDALKSTMECLCFWAPFLSVVEALPKFVLPFVEFYEPNLMLCFEISSFVIHIHQLTVHMQTISARSYDIEKLLCTEGMLQRELILIEVNWCSFWFKDWPSPPQKILGVVDEIVSNKDPELWLHLRHIEAPPILYSWPLLNSAFKTVFVAEDWFILWDHIISKPPPYILCVCAAFILCLRGTLLKCSQASQLKQLYCQETWVAVRDVLRKARIIFASDLPKEFRKDVDKKFLIKNGLVPFDIGPEEDLNQKGFYYGHVLPTKSPEPSGTHMDLNFIRAKSKTTLLPHEKAATSSRLSSPGTSWKSDTSSVSPELAEMEEECLQRIKKTRRKIIGDK